MNIEYSKPTKIVSIKEVMVLLAIVISVGFIIHAAFAAPKEDKTSLQLCQERYMEATNVLFRYNEAHT